MVGLLVPYEINMGFFLHGDMRRAIAALAKNTELVRRLFEYSFKNEEGVIGS
jgi:2-phospho-L-lactate transferase/gluconeogenesis factor (CofD/UPF0052 family)